MPATIFIYCPPPEDITVKNLSTFRLAETINSMFNAVVFLQYSLSTLLICVSIYNLAHTNIMSSEGSGIILYLGCMLMEIFILCAAGNEMTLVVIIMYDYV